MNSKYQSLLKDTAIFALGNMGSKLILFFLVPLYTNYLTASEYGTAELVFTFAQLIMPFASLVIYDAVIRFGMMKTERPNDVLLCGFSVLLFCTIVSVIVTPVLGFYKAISTWKWYLCLYIISSAVAQTEMNFLKVENKNRHYAVYSVIQTGVLAITNILLLVCFKAGIEGYLVANILAQFVVAIAIFLVENVGNALQNASFKPDLLKRMIVFSAPLILNNVSWWVIHSSDKIMIELMISTSALGLYTVATKVPSLINVIVSIFSQAWGVSSIREAESSNDTGFYSSVFHAYSFLTFGAGVAFIAIIKPFMLVYVGQEFRDAWRYAPLLLAAAVFYSISTYFGSLYNALQKTVNSMWTTVLCALINITANYIFIQMVGVWGALIGTVLSYFVIAHVRMFDVKKYIPLQIQWRKYLINTGILLVQSILVSFDFHIGAVSAGAVVLFILNNKNELFTFLQTVLSKCHGPQKEKK